MARPMDPTAPAHAGATATAPAGASPVRAVVVDGPRADGPALAAGDRVAGRYEIVRLLGRGGMGEVYEAEDATLGVRVALKTLPRDRGASDDAIDRLGRELVLARRVGHRHVCRVFDLGQDLARGLWFATMELLEGETLADHLGRVGRLEPARARAILAQLADGLAAAHAASVVHRDLKPGNVILTRDHEGERAVITDFGLARLVDDARITATRFAGTPAYMAPEQLLGERLGPACDVYALGVVAYELVTGELPFTGDGAAATALARLAAPVPAVRARRPELAPGWDALVARCLARDPARRPPADQVVALLDAAPRRRRRWLLAGPVLVAAAAGAVVLAGAGGDAGGPRIDRGARFPFAFGLGGPGDDNVNALAWTTSGDLVLAGHVSADARLAGRRLSPTTAAGRSSYLARVDRLGRPRWVWSVTGEHEVRIAGLTVLPDGDVVGAGLYDAPVTIGATTLPEPAGEVDAFVVRLDGKSGAVRWARAFGATRLAHVRALASDARGAIYLTGEYAGSLTWGEARHQDGGPGADSRAPFVASLAGDGTPRWIAAGHRSAHARAFGLTVAGDRVIASGILWGAGELGGAELPARSSGDGLVIALDAASGRAIWHRLFTGDGPSNLSTVVARDGRLVGAGMFQRGLTVGATRLTATGAMNLFVTELDLADGAPRWATALGGSGTSNPAAIGLTADGRAVVAGKIRGEVSLGPHALAATGDEDVVLAVVDRAGAPVSLEHLGSKARDRARTLAVGPDDVVAVGGMFGRTLTAGRHPLRAAGGASDAFVVEVDLGAAR